MEQCYDVTARATFIACDISAISEQANSQNLTARVNISGNSHYHSPLYGRPLKWRIVALVVFVVGLVVLFMVVVK